MNSNNLTLPTELIALIDAGVWPGVGANMTHQDCNPLVQEDVLHRIIPDQRHLILYPPPFLTISNLIAQGENFWQQPVTAPTQIDPTLTLVIADFGLGGDAVLALDYRQGTVPSVIRLRWYYPEPEKNNKWELVSSNFGDFCRSLDLLPSNKKATPAPVPTPSNQPSGQPIGLSKKLLGWLRYFKRK